MSFDLFPTYASVRRDMSHALSEEIPPLLKELGFVAVSPTRRHSLSLNWYRDRTDIVDALMFQWDKNNTPSLIINFRSFTHNDDIAMCRKSPKDIKAWDFGLRAYMKPGVFGWFKTSYMRNLFIRSKATILVVERMKQSIEDIDNVMKGGVAKTPMQDSSRWLDSRLPDNPPPWPHEFGKIPSSYHLPSFRVGRGDKLATWEL
jgi:hypothetical protein